MPQTRNVAVLIGTEREYHRGVLCGIGRYARLHDSWELLAEPTRLEGELPPRDIRDADGFILLIMNRRQLETMRRWRKPFVNLSSLFPDEKLAHVSNDGTALARMAIEHFIERGFDHFAYCELDENSFYRSRRFEEQLATRGLKGQVFRIDYRQRNDWKMGRHGQLDDWIRSLPKPIGILAHNDVRGRHVVSACHRLHIDVPDQVAVLGIDNERPHCDLCSPPLSSIATDGERIGFEAALLLDQMMDAKKNSGPRILIPPIGVVTRQSTDVMATTDTYVAEAVRYIRQHSCDGIDVGDVLRHVIISRSALDQRFLNTLGRTTHKEILRVRLKRVRELLAETEMTVQLIAERTGFRRGEYLSAVFRREFRQTPREFRDQHRGSL